MENATKLWTETLHMIEEKISKPSYDTWLKSTKAHSFKDDQLIIIAPNEFAKDWLESRYLTLISEIIYELSGIEMNIKFITPQHESAEDLDLEVAFQKSKQMEAVSYAEDHLQNMLNPKYTFDSFVIGTGNRFAHAASLAVAEDPAKAYNPLFVYGGVGLGKTHLMHAIGQYIVEHTPDLRVVYISSEKFTNEFINAIQSNRAEEFRNKYRNVDVLLVDDIQFLAKKEQTQVEFFHTFNALHEENKQIVISSDRPPKEIPTLEDRLRSRFEWGLIIDINPPDLETRIAILRKKAKAEHMDIPNEVMVYIASQVDTNIRELEGALIRVVAYSSLVNQDITAELAKEALKDIISGNKTMAITIARIQQVVSDYFGLRVDDLKAKKRTKAIAFPRQIAMYLSRDLTDSSLPKIGSDFGGRDHTTVIHAQDKIKKALQTDIELQKTIQHLTDTLKGN